jgi:hypothetical protein
MKRIILMYFICQVGLLPSSANQNLRSAEIMGFSHSFAFRPGSSANNTMITFTTFDGANGTPLWENFGGSPIFSWEVRPNLSQQGHFETDYIVMNPSGANLEHGAIDLIMQTGDTDFNGIPDFLQLDKDGVSSFSGTGEKQSAPARMLTIAGILNRAASDSIGDYSLRISSSAGPTTYTGKFDILRWSGKIDYNRSSAGNTMKFELVFHQADGASASFAGESTFVVNDQDTITMPQFTLTNSLDQRITVAATQFTRKEKTYRANVHLSDGLLATSWPDFTSHTWEITDMNDGNGNGIPDLTDVYIPLPVITNQPLSQSASLGQSVVFSVSADSAYPFTYQWQFNGIPLPGATSSAYAIESVQSHHFGAYSVVLTNQGGSMTSEAANLTLLFGPTIQTHPSSQAVLLGETVTFSILASGTAPLIYQWYYNDLPIQGATQASLRLDNVQAAQMGDYYGVVSNLAGSIQSQVAALLVNIPPTITKDPQSVKVPPGATLNLEVTVSGSPPLTYQWYIDDQIIPGAVTSNFTLTNIQVTDSGNYTARVSNSFGSATSQIAIVAVGLAPEIIHQPLGQIITLGEDVILTVEAIGSPPLSYQWRFNGIPLATPNASTLEINNIQKANVGRYSVVVSNAVGSTTSADALISYQQKLISGNFQDSGLFKLELSGQAGFDYIIEWSTDFATWQELATFSNISGKATYTDLASGKALRFYRARKLN